MGTSEILVRSYDSVLSSSGNANFVIPGLSGYYPIEVYATVVSGTSAASITTLIGNGVYAFCYNSDTSGMMTRLPLTNTWKCKVLYAKNS